MDDDDDELVPSAATDDFVAKWFDEYARKGGLLPRSVCVPLLECFGEFVSKAVVGEPQDRAMVLEANQRDVDYRKVAFDRWSDFMKRLGHPRAEAKKIWQAVDTVTPMT